MNRDDVYNKAIQEVYDLVNKIRDRVTVDNELWKKIEEISSKEYERQIYLEKKQAMIDDKKQTLAERTARMADVRNRYNAR